MKTRVICRLAVVLAFLGSSRAHAIGTAFTYQGQLQQGGTPRTGPCDLQFSLFDAVAFGTQIGTTLGLDDVAVSGGRFTVQLDFGATALTGLPAVCSLGVGGRCLPADRWLQIAVRCPAGSGEFTTIAPRQALTATPYALFAQEIADGAVTDAKVASGITYGKLTGAPTSLPPSGPAGGILTGTYPNPGLAANTIASGHILDGAITAADVSTSSVQVRVSGACDPGACIRAVNANGSVTCETALQDRVAALEAKLASVSLQDGGATVRFTGVNVQVVSGSGATTGTINGRGNLIVGYNESSSDTKTGSHNVVIGTGHTYTGQAGLIAGQNNAIGGTGAFVAGADNTASGNYSSVSGGRQNIAASSYSSVSGGRQNTASTAFYSTVSGGYQNAATGLYATVSGGEGNNAGGIVSSISGGDYNTTAGNYDSIGGGRCNYTGAGTPPVCARATTFGADAASISGGKENRVSGIAAWVGGGKDNWAADYYNSISGGQCNYTGSGTPPDPATCPTEQNPGRVASIVGGTQNRATGRHSSVVGGYLNTVEGIAASISGGSSHHATADASSIGGGANLETTERWSFLAGDSSFHTVTITSDRNAKEAFTPIAASDILEMVVALPIGEWQYKSTPGVRHIGPTAQDFRGAFQVGRTDEGIATVDADGVALAAIQGLHALLEKQQRAIDELSARLDACGGMRQ